MRIIALLALLLAGCASPIHTKANWLSTDTAIVSGDGYWVHSGGDVSKAMLLKAAREGQARGFSHFKILQSQDRSGSVSTSNAGPLMWVPTGQGSGMLVPTYSNSSQAVAPRGDVTVRFYREGLQPSGAWSCAEVLAAR